MMERVDFRSWKSVRIKKKKDYDIFENYLRKLYEISAWDHTNRSIGLVCFYSMSFYMLKKEYQNSINCGLEAIRYLEETEEYDYLCNTLNKLGILMQYQGNMENGIGYFLKAIEYYQYAKDGEIGLGKAYHNLGNIFKEANNCERALFFYSQAEKIFEKYP